MAGLVGRGIQASSSPAIHKREAAAQGFDLAYELFDFDRLMLPDSKLPDLLQSLAERGFAGVNITHPFKQEVIASLDEIDLTAKALGAVNCVKFENGRAIGSNSDWIGFSFMMQSELPNAALDRVAQIGAGGAGSATAFALLALGVSELRIQDVSAARIGALIERLASQYPHAELIACSTAQTAIEGVDGIVQSTPVGMADHPGVPFAPELLEPGQWLAEIIYFPRETQLLHAARAKGLACANGAAMVIGQAAEAFRLFTDAAPDRDRMLATFTANDIAVPRRAGGAA